MPPAFLTGELRHVSFNLTERLNSQKQKLKNNDALALAQIRQDYYALKLVFRIE